MTLAVTNRKSSAPAGSAPTIAHRSSVENGVSARPGRVIFSFDVEEHHRIEAAAGLAIDSDLCTYYRARLFPSTQWLLDLLAQHNALATFFILGEIAQHSPALVRSIHRAGHEVASHGWNHRRVTSMTPDEFRMDVRASKDALEQVTGEAVVGYRAPTFSIGPANPWAIDVLAEEGFTYDSSIFPVRHDRYGVPAAPRQPFIIRGERHRLLELPPATWRTMGANLPMGGGGYFRLFPLWCTKKAVRQATSEDHGVAMLYFHPWEFDPEQRRLPMGRRRRWRTYVGVGRARYRLADLLRHCRSHRTIDVVPTLRTPTKELAEFSLPG
jgi:polysaccharide deacetylase family protein (PEP-CTERM system associated)